MCLFVNGKLFRCFSEDLWLILTYDIHLPCILSLFWAKKSKSLSWMMGCKKVCPGGMRSNASLPKIRHSVAGLFESVPLCHVNDCRIDPLKWIMLFEFQYLTSIPSYTFSNWYGDSLWLMSLDVLFSGHSLDVGDPDSWLRQVKRVEFWQKEDTLSLVFKATLSENACTMRQRWDLEAYDVIWKMVKVYRR